MYNPKRFTRSTRRTPTSRLRGSPAPSPPSVPPLKAHGLFVSIKSRLESNKEEEVTPSASDRIENNLKGFTDLEDLKPITWFSCSVAPFGNPYHREVDIRLPGKGNSNSVAQGRSTKTISMIKWIRTSRLSMKNSLLNPYRFRANKEQLQRVQRPFPAK